MGYNYQLEKQILHSPYDFSKISTIINYDVFSMDSRICLPTFLFSLTEHFQIFLNSFATHKGPQLILIF